MSLAIIADVKKQNNDVKQTTVVMNNSSTTIPFNTTIPLSGTIY